MSSATVEHDNEVPLDEAWEPVCLVDDLVRGSGVCVLFHYRQVALFYVGKPPTVYAIANFDPFSKANVLSRGIVGTLKDQLVVASPIFKQHFSLETGSCLEDDTVHVEVFQARIAGNHVQLRKET